MKAYNSLWQKKTKHMTDIMGDNRFKNDIQKVSKPGQDDQNPAVQIEYTVRKYSVCIANLCGSEINENP